MKYGGQKHSSYPFTALARALPSRSIHRMLRGHSMMPFNHASGIPCLPTRAPRIAPRIAPVVSVSPPTDMISRTPPAKSFVYLSQVWITHGTVWYIYPEIPCDDPMAVANVAVGSSFSAELTALQIKSRNSPALSSQSHSSSSLWKCDPDTEDTVALWYAASAIAIAPWSALGSE